MQLSSPPTAVVLGHPKANGLSRPIGRGPPDLPQFTWEPAFHHSRVYPGQETCDKNKTKQKKRTKTQKPLNRTEKKGTKQSERQKRNPGLQRKPTYKLLQRPREGYIRQMRKEERRIIRTRKRNRVFWSERCLICHIVVNHVPILPRARRLGRRAIMVFPPTDQIRVRP